MIGEDSRTRSEVIKLFEKWIQTQPELLIEIKKLKGKTLGCWCAPNDCHGRIIAKIADRSEFDDIIEF